MSDATTTAPLIAVEIPMALPSRANRRGSTRKSIDLVRRQRSATQRGLLQFERPPLPVTVRMTRIAPRHLDHGDNASMSLKSVRDQIAHWLCADDADPRIVWLPVQQDTDGRPRYQAARIEIWQGQERCQECGQPVPPSEEAA